MSARKAGKDLLTKERRSWNMSRIRGKDTTPEKTVRSLLHKMGYRFRLHRRIQIEGRAKLPLRPELAAHQRPAFARPDIVLPKHKIAIFVHGCFWHRHPDCKNCTTPTNRRDWWLAKFNGSAARDKLYQAALRSLGWPIILIWECETEKSASSYPLGYPLGCRPGTDTLWRTVPALSFRSSASTIFFKHLRRHWMV